jgi:hypothetical protein
MAGPSRAFPLSAGFGLSLTGMTPGTNDESR